jgi:hypothetical protein
MHRQACRHSFYCGLDVIVNKIVICIEEIMMKCAAHELL